MRSINRMRLFSICSWANGVWTDEEAPTEVSRASPMASKADDERPSTISRYFWAIGRSAGWIRAHQRRTDSCTSASLFSPTTRESINRYTLLLMAWYDTEISWGIGVLVVAVLNPKAIREPNRKPLFS